MAVPTVAAMSSSSGIGSGGLGSLFSGLNLVFTSLLLVNVALYFFVFTSPIASPPRGQPLQACVSSAYDPSPAAIATRREHFSSPQAVSALRETYRDKHVHLVGDSTLRESYYELVSLLRREGVGGSIEPAVARKREATKHQPQLSRIGSSTVSWAWRPFLRNATEEWSKLMAQEFKPDLVVFSLGLHDLLYSSPASIQRDLKDFVSTLAKQHAQDPAARALTPSAAAQTSALSTAALKVPVVVFRSSPALRDKNLKGHRQEATQFRSAQVAELNVQIQRALDSLSAESAAWADGHALTSHDFEGSSSPGDDGLHSQHNAVVSALSLAAFSSCHFGTPPLQLTAGQLTIVIFALGLLFTTFYAVLSSYLQRPSSMYLSVPQSDVAVEEGAGKEGEVVTKEHSGAPSTTLSSAGNSYSGPLLRTDAVLSKENSSVLFALLQLAFILLFLFVVDGDQRLAWQLIGDKTFVKDTFAFICLLLALCSFTTVTPTAEKGPGTILNRDQTEEWKGVMQILFVLYHYFAAKELYNLIRVFIAAYVFLTGYGNLFFFQRYADYSLTRLCKMMFRLNFFVTLVCVVMNRDYMQYYVCALHSSFFLFVYLFMLIGSQHNKSTLFMSGKFVAGFAFLFLVWDVPNSPLFELLFSHLSLFYWHGSVHEWRFRSTLDHLVTIIGMLVASHIHQLAALYAYMDKQSKGTRRLVQGLCIAVCSLVLYLWYEYVLLLPKPVYNRYNPYTTFIPIVTYIALRNLTPWLRTHNLHLFTWCGRITLETYILQFHIWLSDDAATLVFYTGSFDWPLVNFVLASVIYIALAYQVFQITNVVSDAVVPKNATTWTLAARIVMIAAVWASVYHSSRLLLMLQAR